MFLPSWYSSRETHGIQAISPNPCHANLYTNLPRFYFTRQGLPQSKAFLRVSALLPWTKINQSLAECLKAGLTLFLVWFCWTIHNWEPVLLLVGSIPCRDNSHRLKMNCLSFGCYQSLNDSSFLLLFACLLRSSNRLAQNDQSVGTDPGSLDQNELLHTASASGSKSRR